MKVKQKISVSVIIPCYKCEKTIIRAVESIVEQSCVPLEILLIDDNEEEAAGLKLKEVERKFAKYLNIRVVSYQGNHGAPTARNAGWKIAEGKYVAFLDSDDAWHPSKLQLQYGFMESHEDVKLSGHDVMIVGGNPKPVRYGDVFDFSSIGSTSILFKNSLPTPTWMIRRDLPLRFDESMKCVDDHLFLMELILPGNKVEKIHLGLAFVFKPMFGSSGLSGNLFRMEWYELRAYYKIFTQGKINILLYIVTTFVSLVKLTRRLAIKFFRCLVRKR